MLCLMMLTFLLRPLSICSAESTLSMPTVDCGVYDLALEVGFVDYVEVDEAEGAYSCGGEVEREGGSEASGAYAEDLCRLQFLLALHAYLGKDEVAGVAGDLFVGELGELDGFFDGCGHG